MHFLNARAVYCLITDPSPFVCSTPGEREEQHLLHQVAQAELVPLVCHDRVDGLRAERRVHVQVLEPPREA